MESDLNIQAMLELERNLEKLKANVGTTKDSLLFDEPTTAKRLGIGYSTLKLLRQGGKISHIRIGKRVFYRLIDVEKFIAGREVVVA
jgi:hypothetical protein